MKRFRWLVLVLAVVALTAWSACPALAQKITWKMASAWPAGTQVQWAADFFAETVNGMSGGRLEIKSYPAGKLVGAMEVFDAARMGTIEVAHASPAYWIGKIPAAALFGYQPFGMEVLPYLTWLYEGEGMALYHELYAPHGFGFVATCGILPPEDLAWSNKPIKTLADFKGLKFRTSGYWGEILTEAGASVVMLPAGQIYEALQRAVIDAGEFSIPSMDRTLAFHEISKYLLVPGIHQPSTLLDILVSKKAWGGLPKDLQEIVKAAGQAATMRMLTNSIQKDMAALEFFKEKGITINYVDPKVQKELYAKAVTLMESKAAKDPFFKKVWDSQRKFREEYKKYQGYMELQFE